MNNSNASNSFFQKYFSLLCVFIFTPACNSISTEKQKIATSQTVSESCLIVLTEHPGEKKTDEQIQGLQQKLTKTPTNLALLEKLGWAFIEKTASSFDPGFLKLAEQCAECMLKNHPEHLPAALLLGHINHQLHHFKVAEKIAHRLVSERGQWYDYGLLGDSLMEQGQLLEATSAYQQMMDQNPGSQSYNRAANMRWITGDIEGAMEFLQLSLSAQGGQKSINNAWTVTRLAKIEFHNQQFESSSKHLQNLLAKQPEYAPALLLLGQINLYLGNQQQATELLNKAYQLNPLPEYNWTLQEALAVLGKTSHHQQLQNKLFNSGEIEDRRTFALYLASTAKNTDKAVTLAEQELQQRQDVFTLDTYAWALYSNNRQQEALHYSQKALQPGTPSARLYYHAAVIAHSNNKTEQARQLFQRAKSIAHTLLPSERQHLNQFL